MIKAYIKVWWHCLLYIFTWNIKDIHQQCTISGSPDNKKWIVQKHFCSCGYNNNGKTWAEELSDSVYDMKNITKVEMS